MNKGLKKNHIDVPAKTGRVRGGFVGEIKKNWTVYLMALPGLLVLFVFCYLPMGGIIIAFQKYSPALGILKSTFVGIDNFVEFFKNPYFMRCLKNTLGISIYSIAAGFPAPIILALLLNEVRNKWFKKTVQTITYMPYFISTVVIAGLIMTFTASNGIICDILAPFGFAKKNLLNEPSLFKTIYVISEIWQQVGWGSIVYLAALTSIDDSLYEAALLDGAGRLRQTWHITIPGILPTMVTLLILRLGTVMTVGFEKIILIYNASTYEVAETISTYVYKKGLLDMDYSYSAAVGLFNSVANLIILLIANKLSKKYSEVGLF